VKTPYWAERINWSPKQNRFGKTKREGRIQKKQQERATGSKGIRSDGQKSGKASERIQGELKIGSKKEGIGALSARL